VQVAGVAQDNPLNPAPIAPAGLGTDWTLHLVPFQLSASGTGFWALLISLPPAAQAVAVGQDTARSSLASDPADPETGWKVQLVPFHRSASGVVTPVLLDLAPTAVQARAEAHETAKNPAAGNPAGAGAGRMAQLVPFHTSTSGRICRAASVQ
jgi:hypothetical protein